MALTARDVMQPDVRSVPPTMSLAELEDFFIAERVSGAPVVESGKLVGIVSRSDIVRVLSLARSLSGQVADAAPQAEFAPGDVAEPLPETVTADLRPRTVREAMVADPIRVAPEMPLRELAKLFIAHHVHRVLVTEGDDLLGVITNTDLVQCIAEGKVREA